MRPPPIALNQVRTKDLENALRALHRGELKCPITHETLATSGLAYLWDKIDFLHGLDERAVRAVLVAVLAERRAALAG